jgi:hypothetical protein
MSSTLAFVMCGIFLAIGAGCSFIALLSPTSNKPLAVSGAAGFASAAMSFFLPVMAFPLIACWLMLGLAQASLYKNFLGRFVLGAVLVVSCLPSAGIAVEGVSTGLILSTWGLLTLFAVFTILSDGLKGMRW